VRVAELKAKKYEYEKKNKGEEEKGKKGGGKQGRLKVDQSERE
jgi:hypothetical protein